jgi:hypothetical protein
MNQTEVSRSYTTKQEQAYQFSLKGNCKMKRLNGNWSCSWPQARLLFSYQHGMKIDLVLQWKALIQYPLHQECHCRYSPKRFCPLHRILTHLWEQLRKGELQYAFEVCNLSIKKVCNLAIYAKKRIILLTYSATKFYDTNIGRSFFAFDRIHCNTFNPILYFICNMWHDLILKLNTGLINRNIFSHKKLHDMLITDLDGSTQVVSSPFFVKDSLI